MVALTMKTPLPGKLAARLHRWSGQIERRKAGRTDMTLYDERGNALGRVRALDGTPAFGPDAPEVFLDRGV